MSKVYATMSGFVGFEGRSVPIHEGDEYEDTHPMVKAFPQHFTSAVVPAAIVRAAKGKRN